MAAGNQHPWRIMTALFGGVLLFCFLLQMALTPVGDAMERAMIARQAKLSASHQVRR